MYHKQPDYLLCTMKQTHTRERKQNKSKTHMHTEADMEDLLYSRRVKKKRQNRDWIHCFKLKHQYLRRNISFDLILNLFGGKNFNFSSTEFQTLTP